MVAGLSFEGPNFCYLSILDGCVAKTWILVARVVHLFCFLVAVLSVPPGEGIHVFLNCRAAVAECYS